MQGMNLSDATNSHPYAQRLMLVILDGWGLAEDKHVSAIDNASTPFYDMLMATMPHTRLMASETAVGLPKGQMGNSEIGHMNLGAGRIVLTELERINRSIALGEIAQNPNFRNTIAYCKQHNKPLHLIGLVSDGGVHSSLEHIEGLIAILAKEQLQDVFIHAFTDGRDTDPQTGAGYLTRLKHFMVKHKCGRIASVIGRFYAMDRDNRWERTQKAYKLLTQGEGTPADSTIEAVLDSYNRHITDEFIEPIIRVDSNGKPIGLIQEGDAVISFNFRTDRMRQLTAALTQKDFPEYDMHPLDLQYATMTCYDANFQNIAILFDKEPLKNTLGEVLSTFGKKQIRIAETEKYPHVTYFFNGGREKPMEGEERILCPSPKVRTYDLKPEMSAGDIRDAIIPRIKSKTADFICLNFANPDMVGHTGVFGAAIKACEAVDTCLRDVVKAAVDNGYTLIILADHGNADRMINPDGSPHTAHTLALVPCILVNAPKDFTLTTQVGKLADVAPTILTLMGLPIAADMDGDVLVTVQAPAIV